MSFSPQQLEEKIEKATPSLEVTQIEVGTSLLQDSLRKFKKNKMAMWGLAVTLFLFMVSLLAPWVTPYSYDEGKLQRQNFPPSWYRPLMSSAYKEQMFKWANSHQGETEDFFFNAEEGAGESKDTTATATTTTGKPEATGLLDQSIDHLTAEGAKIYLQDLQSFSHLMGTDELGQDIFSRVIFGMRLSLFLAVTVTLISLLIGVSYGAISGFFGGMVDSIMMRIVDFLFGIPFIFMIILLMVFFGRHVALIFVGLGLVYWIVLARIVRGQVMSIKQKEFVLAAITNGVGNFQLIFKHLVPNVLGPVIVFSTLLVPQIMLLEAFLSFIGLGVSPPEVSLGIMISDGANVFSSYSWPILFPGIVFSLIIFCLNFIGDGIRDALDPKQSK